MSETQKSSPSGAINSDVILIIAVIASAVLSFIGIQIMGDVLALHTLADLDNPYFVKQHAVLLYAMAPLVNVAFSLFFLSPGLLLTAAFAKNLNSITWALCGFAVSLGLVTATTGLAQAILGFVLREYAFYFLVLCLVIMSLVIYLLRRCHNCQSPLDLNGTGRDLLFAGVTAWAILLFMSAKFYWENLSSDGGGVLHFSRLLVHTNWPFWPPEAGSIQQAPGLTSFLFVLPSSWFVRLIGENEFAVRAPHIMYIGLLYTVILGMIRTGRNAKIYTVDHLLIGAALLVYSLSVIYSGGYNPYFGDSPMPAARETMVVTLFLGFIYFFVNQQKNLMFLFGILSYLSLPTGGLWLLLWPIAVCIVWRPLPKPMLIWNGALLVTCALLGQIFPLVVELFDLPFPGSEFDARNIINRLRYISFFDANRIAYLVVPAGVLPAIGLVFWKFQDNVSRALTLTTAAFFLFFYFQGYRVLMHHFIPAMIPPLIVMWRYKVTNQSGYWIPTRAAVTFGLVASLWLAWPQNTGLHTFSRHIGQNVLMSGERFNGFSPKALDTFHTLFGKLFPIQYTEEKAEKNYFGGPLVWYFYGLQEKTALQDITYDVRPLSADVPSGGRLFSEYDGYGLYILDEAVYAAHKSSKFSTHFGAPIFQTSRNDIFGTGARSGDRTVIDLVSIARGILGIEKPEN